MAILKKNRISMRFVVALMVVMATVLLSSCHAHKEMEHEPAAFPVPASCYSNYFPHCTDERCRNFCGYDQPPVPGAFCNDNSNCCCPVN
ncbi:hypothetical protein ACQ4PT_015101 [Festuca glaucescens]